MDESTIVCLALATVIVIATLGYKVKQIMLHKQQQKAEWFRPVKGHVCKQRQQMIKRLLERPIKSDLDNDLPCTWLKIGIKEE